jgi:hypothetical protein
MKPLPADWLETTLTRPMPVLANAPARGWAALGTWFETPTPQGPLRLYLGEAAGPAPHAAAAALALQRAGELLFELDAWLGDGAPDWRWVPDAAAAGSAAATALGPSVLRLPWRDTTHQLIVPWPWLRAQPAAPAALAARWWWPATEAVLAIERLHLSAAELQQLEPGGAVLLPASMRPGWSGRLRGLAEDVDVGVPVALDDPASPRLLPARVPSLPDPGCGVLGGAVGGALSAAVGGAVSGALGGDRSGDRGGGLGADFGLGLAVGRLCEVRLHLPHAIPADRLAGWHEQPLADAVTPDLAATLWQLPAGREPACCLAHGRLLPWGDGWALLLHALGDPEQAHVSAA